MSSTLLLCFIHGFSGDDDTFHNFPNHLKDAAQKALPNWKVISIVYPKYETKGDLPSCVTKFRAWLDNHVNQLEAEAKTASSNDGQAVRTILVAHSMGGFVAADTVLSIADDQSASASDSKDAKLPLIQGILAMDTPFLGISSPMLAYSAFSQFSKVSSAYRLMAMLPASFLRGKDTSGQPARRGGYQRTAWELGAIPAWRTIAAYAGTSGALAAAGVAAYMNREELYQGYTWIQNHLQFVGVIMKREESRMKLARITALEGFGFANLYTTLGQNSMLSGGTYVPERTFCALPPADNPLARAFRKEINLVAKDEIDAHMSMFQEERNPGYNRLLDDSQGLIAEWAQREFTGYKTHDLEQKTNDAMDSRTTDALDTIQSEQETAIAAGLEGSADQGVAEQPAATNLPSQDLKETMNDERVPVESEDGRSSEQQTEPMEKFAPTTSNETLTGNPLDIVAGAHMKAPNDKTELPSDEKKSEEAKDGGSSGQQTDQTGKPAQRTSWADKLPGNPLNLLPGMHTKKASETAEDKAEPSSEDKSLELATSIPSSEKPGDGMDKLAQSTRWVDKIPRNPLTLLPARPTKDQTSKESPSREKEPEEARDTGSADQPADGTAKSAQTTKWTDKIPRSPMNLLSSMQTSTSSKTPGKPEEASSEKKESSETRDTTGSNQPADQTEKPAQATGTTWMSKLPGNPLNLLPGQQRK